MIVSRLQLSSFRNFENAFLEPVPTVNVFYGDNAQGKTNLLEAVWLFTGSRSFRGAKDSELVRFGKNMGEIQLEYFSQGRSHVARMEIAQSRKAWRNHIELKSPALLAGTFCAVVFSPDHLNLVKEGPHIRRKFMDAAICQLWPKYIALLLNYNKALAHRNALLKDIPRHSELLDTMQVWEEKLAHTGAQIIATRMAYLDLLKEQTGRVFSGISSGNEKIELRYHSGDQETYPDGSGIRSDQLRQIREFLLAAFRRHRSLDLEAGYTHDGPHRDDLVIFINDLSARLYASQGQQRSAVLSLKLAEASVLCEKTGEPPVLLLDDVMSELDKNRQEYILNHIQGWQVFLTCCDASGFSALQSGKVFEIRKGTIAEIR